MHNWRQIGKFAMHSCLRNSDYQNKFQHLLFVKQPHIPEIRIIPPDAAVQSILARAEANYDIPFDNNQWQLERATVDAGGTERPPLDAQTASPRQSE